MTPTDPQLWSLLPAPLAFIGGCFALAIILTREIRKLIAERNADQAEQIKALRTDVTDLTAEVERLRDQAIEEARAAHERQLILVRDNGRLITLLAKHGIDPEEQP